MLQRVFIEKNINRHFSLNLSKFCNKNNCPQCLVVFAIVILGFSTIRNLLTLNEYFTTVASSLLVDQPPMANSLLPDLTSDAPETNFVFHLVSEEDVFKFLRTMDVTKATGVDNIPAKILRIAAPCISRNITHLLNVSYLTGQFPLS